MIHCLKIPETVQFKPVANLNTQPGDLAIRAALQLSHELKREGVLLGKSAKRARTLLCLEAEQRNWMETPFQGLNPELNQRIRTHFAAANNRFANRIWGCPWDQIFNPDMASQSRIPSTAEQRAIDQTVKRIRRRLIPQSRGVKPWIRLLTVALGMEKERC